MAEDRCDLGGRIKRENLGPFLEMLTLAAGYNPSRDEWTAWGLGVRDTDVTQWQWYDYPLIGSATVHLHLARDRQRNEICVLLSIPSRVKAELDLLLAVASEYVMADGPPCEL